jgi:hypothetical protein
MTQRKMPARELTKICPSNGLPECPLKMEYDSNGSNAYNETAIDGDYHLGIMSPIHRRA